MHPFIADEVIAMSKMALKLLYAVIIFPLLKDGTKNQHTYVKMRLSLLFEVDRNLTENI